MDARATRWRGRIPPFLNLASLMLALVGAVLAGYPALFPFQGQEMRDTTVDALAPSKTPAFEEWGIRNDGLARGGLFCVALATGAGAAAQLLEQTDGKTR